MSDIPTFEFPALPLADPARPFLDDGERSWSAGELLALASRMGELTPEREDRTIGVSSGSAAFVAAAAVSAWSRGAAPLILDPNLKNEPAHVLEHYPGLPILVPAPRTDLQNALVVHDEAAHALEQRWPEGGEPLALFFTSGSTGEPKVVEKRAMQFFNQVRHEIPWLGIQPGVRVFAMVPPFHILGFVYGLAIPMAAAGHTSFLHGAAPAAWARFITEQRPDVVVGVPSHYRFLLNCLEKELPPALYLSSGGPLTPDIDQDFQAASGQSILQVYGSTETGGVAARRGFGPWRSFPGLEWRVRPEDGRLMVRSPWQAEAERWIVTDDLAEPAAAGFELRGRADSVVKVGGKRFSTNEILQVTERLPGVGAAVTVSYERFGENALALFLSPRPGGQLEEAGVRSELNAQLAPFKVPRTIRVLEQLPLLSNGKVDRRRLKELAVDSERPAGQ